MPRDLRSVASEISNMKFAIRVSHIPSRLSRAIIDGANALNHHALVLTQLVELCYP